MRVLHAGLRHRQHRLREKESQCKRRRCPPGSRGQSLPLRNLRRHVAGGSGRSKNNEGRRLMSKVQWPEKRELIGTRISRIDGPVKSTGTAKYSFDINRPGMLWAKVVTSPHARAEVVSVDLSPAQSMPCVKVVWKDDNLI